MKQIEIEKLWQELGDIPINDNEEIELDFHLWKAGTHREDIWHWFDDQYEESGGVTSLMYK